MYRDEAITVEEPRMHFPDVGKVMPLSDRVGIGAVLLKIGELVWVEEVVDPAEAVISDGDVHDQVQPILTPEQEGWRSVDLCDFDAGIGWHQAWEGSE